MTEEKLDWLDDIADKLIANEKITEEEADDLLNYVHIPAVLNKQLSPEVIRYIDLIDNYELVDELPENPLDTGGHEYLANSIETANLIHANRQLDENERTHLITDLIRPLEFIFTGTDSEVFQAIVKTLTKEPSQNEKEYFPKEEIEKMMGKTFKQSLFSVIALKATDTFIERVRESIEIEDVNDDIKQIREFLPNIDNFGYSNTKVENELTKPSRSLEETIKNIGFNADVARDDDRKKGISKPVTARLALLDETMLPKGFNYSLSVRKLVSAVGNAYDLAELETKVAGAKSIRIDHLINIMDDKPATTRVTTSRVKEVTEQIKVLRNISIEIDATQHKEYNKSKPKGVQLEQDKFTGFLLPVEILERKEFSKDKQVYISILKRPVLYEYAREAGQIITVEKGLLDLTTYPEGKAPKIDRIERMTQQISALADLMILETRGRGRKKPYTAITFNRIYEYVDDDLGRKVRRQTLNSNIEKVAKALVAKGEFKKYEIVKKGKKRYGTLHLYKK